MRLSEPFNIGVYSQKKSMIFNKKKYIVMIWLVSLLTLGFILMSGGGSSNPAIFNEEIFSFRRITLAPIIIISSYAGLIWLILKRSTN